LSAENVAVVAPPAERAERRSYSRIPLRLIFAILFVVGGFWLMDLWTDPTWSKIQSFLVGYFAGTFFMDWIRQRAARTGEPVPAVGRGPTL
jgi:putative intracellular protease/amidase